MRAVQFLTALTIAAASSASAQPVPVPVPLDRDDRVYDDDRRYDRYDRYDRNVYDRDRYARWDGSRHWRDRGRWFPLMRFSDADDRRTFVDLGGRGGRLDMLRIEADRGTPLIKRIAVEYLNGAREVIRIDSTFSRGHGQVIDLRGDRRVARIVVVTDPRFDGLYSIYGT